MHLQQYNCSRIKLLKVEADYSRWSFIIEIWKNGDTLAALVTVDDAWMDTGKRKLVAPPESFNEIFRKMSAAEQ